MKYKLQCDGWTPEKLRQRLTTCRENRRQFRAITTNARFTYRLLNAALYLKHKAMLRALS